MTKRIFIFGAGYSGRAYARAVADEADFIGGTTRSPEMTAALRNSGITPFIFDGSTLSPEIAEALETTTHLVISIAPGEGGDPVLNTARDVIAKRMPVLAWIGYLSTVGVYGDHGCAWVNEESECRPVSARSVARVEAENAWLGLGAETGKPVAVLRLSGIYGPGRNAFVNLETGKARRVIKPGQVFNRIHVDDIAGALVHLAHKKLDGVFNVTDDEPGPPQDVVAYAAGLMGVEPPREIPFEQADFGPMARSFWSECKRVSNGKLKETGYRYRHRNYRAALEAMWREGNWKVTKG